MLGLSTIAIWCLGSLIVALLGFYISNRLMKPVELEKDQGFLDATLAIVGTLVSILLGLLVSNSLDYYDHVETNAGNEAGSVSEIFRLSKGLPDGPGVAIRKLCEDYNSQVLNEEWAAMGEGHMSPRAAVTYGDLDTAIIAFHATNDRETMLQSSMITSVINLGDCRRDRAMVLKSRWCERILPVILGCAMIVLVYSYLYTRKEKRLLHAMLICFVAAALGANMSMVFMLRNPFRTEWKLVPEGFLLNSELIESYHSYGKLP